MADIYFDPDNAQAARDGSQGNPYQDPSELPVAWRMTSGNRYLFKRGTETNFEAAFRCSSAPAAAISVGTWGDGAAPIITMYRLIDSSECTEVSMDEAGVTTPTSSTNLWRVPRQFFGLYSGEIWGARRDWVNALGYGVQALDDDRHWTWADGNTSAVVYSVGNPVTVYGGLYVLTTSDANWSTDAERVTFHAVQVPDFTLEGLDIRFAFHGVRMTANAIVVDGIQTIRDNRFRSVYRGIEFGGLTTGDVTDAGGFSGIRVHDNYCENMGNTGIDAAAATGGTRMNNARIYRNVVNGFGGAESSGGIYLGRCFTSDGTVILVTQNCVTGGLANRYWIYDGYALYVENSTQDILWFNNFVWNCERNCHTNYPRRNVTWRSNVVIAKESASGSYAFSRVNATVSKPGYVRYEGNVAVGFSRFLYLTNTAAEKGIVRVLRNISLAEYPGGAYRPYAVLADHADSAALIIDGNNFYGHEDELFDTVGLTAYDSPPQVNNKITSDPSAELARLPTPTDPTVNYALQIKPGARIVNGTVDLRPGTRVAA